jgi:hypothetical protein
MNKSKNFDKIKEAKIKIYNMLKPTDFVKIGDVYEPKRDGLIKILSSLPISYSWNIIEKKIFPGEYALIQGVLKIEIEDITRTTECIGHCEANEFTGKMRYTLHNMVTKAETRALKRAIETLFGSVINYYVKNVLEAA